MRRRLLIALTVFSTLAVLAFAIPLCLTAATSRTQELVLGRTGDADRFAALTVTANAVGDRRALVMEVDRYHDLYGEPVLVVDARGAPIVNAGVDAADPVVTAALSAARRNQRAAAVGRLSPWSPDTVLIARPVGSDAHVDGAVLIGASTTDARTDITYIWTIVAVGALLAMAVFTALALVLSRWVLRPLAGLSTAVAELTASLPTPRTPAAVTRRHGGPPELRAVAESVDTMAAAVRDSAAAQRRLVDDTAHAMRNPLAALTIRLDSLEPAIPAHAAPTFHGATREVERLTALLDGLLTLAVAEAHDFDPAHLPATESCDAVQVVQDRIDAWHSAYERANMTLAAEFHSAPTSPGLDTDSDTRPATGRATPAPPPGVLGDTGGTAAVLADESGIAPGGSVGRAPATAPGDLGDRSGADPAGHPATPPAALASAGPTGTAGLVHAEAAISADALAQVLDVALSNSCRYAGAGAHTRVLVATRGGRVVLTVADNGRGVPGTELPELTTRFYRGASATGIGGSGLGLPIAAALTAARHGRLTVESVDPHGVAVLVDLPAAVHE
ncbi:sensor histidine kinase [Nocardia sp. NPDC127526]|uniref:sensor histidine kinase n=1 Tax=Nocardia sp. NPDC127526 TaxID=3345393 RepID=UPI0036416264